MATLTYKSDRKKLPPRPDPYWQRIDEGCYLGFRTGPQTWLARYRDRNKVQHFEPLGQGLEFAEAKAKADAFFGRMGASVTRAPKRDTVRSALETYLKHLREQGRTAAAATAASRFGTVVYKDQIADAALESVTAEDFREWRQRILVDGRAPRSVNRYVRQVSAALNVAVKHGHIGSPEAWKLEPIVDDIEDSHETAVFLAPEQRKALIAAATPAAALFFQGLQHTGARPGELAATKAADFNGESVRLASRKGKSSKLRIRRTTLDAAGVKFFEAQTAGKAASAPIFTEDGSQPWRRENWAEAVRDAITKHNEDAKGKDRLPAGLGAYAFRHARISELLQIHGVDPVTTALQCGTSTVVIERTYAKFIPSAMAAKLKAVRA